MMAQPIYAYTLSSRRSLAQEAIQSIKSLLNWVPASQIIVFYTPPRREDHRQALESLGVDVREVDNVTNPFAMGETSKPSYYGEKVRIGTIDSDTVVFLDCDTIVLDDPVPVLEGSFDFKARPGSYHVPKSEWKALFDKYGEEFLDWMPNAGFMVFKNGTHKKIRTDWRKYIAEEIELPSSNVRHGEQYALALAISSYETAKMAPTEHVMRWENEAPADGIVYHGYYPSWKDSGTHSFKHYAMAAAKELLKGNF